MIYISFRVCSECDSLFDEGWCIDEGSDYYCSEECLTKNMTWEEFLELREEVDSQTYWTYWWSDGISEWDLETLHEIALDGKLEEVKCFFENRNADDYKTVADYLNSKGLKIA